MNKEQTLKQRLWTVSIALGGILTALAAVVLVKELKAIAYVGSDAPVNTISVDGTGHAYAAPDVATFSFTVSDTESDVASAQAKATAAASTTLAAVAGLGIADKDVQTTDYSISPHYEYDGGVCASGGICTPSRQRLSGYDVSETVQVKLHDISKAGQLLAALGSAGVQNLNGPDFSVNDPNSVQAEARAAAIADAQSQAQTLARQLGVSLGAIQGFSESSGGYPRPMAYAMAAGVASDAAAPPQIATGQEEVTDNVTITYQIR